MKRVNQEGGEKEGEGEGTQRSESKNGRVTRR